MFRYVDYVEFFCHIKQSNLYDGAFVIKFWCTMLMCQCLRLFG